MTELLKETPRRSIALVIVLVFSVAASTYAQGNSARARTKRAWDEYYAYNDQTASEMFSAVIEEFPDYGDAYWGRAQVYFDLQEYDKALEDFLKAEELLDEPEAEVAYMIGSIALRSQNPVFGGDSLREAIEWFTKTIERNPDFHEAYDQRALAYSFLDDPVAADRDSVEFILRSAGSDDPWIVERRSATTPSAFAGFARDGDRRAADCFLALLDEEALGYIEEDRQTPSSGWSHFFTFPAIHVGDRWADLSIVTADGGRFGVADLEPGEYLMVFHWDNLLNTIIYPDGTTSLELNPWDLYEQVAAASPAIRLVGLLPAEASNPHFERVERAGGQWSMEVVEQWTTDPPFPIGFAAENEAVIDNMHNRRYDVVLVNYEGLVHWNGRIGGRDTLATNLDYALRGTSVHWLDGVCPYGVDDD